ncbi:tetratricopeptide repeat protein [Isoptericola jiangsuensis]|uniref:Tetratricopeptide repeat protein n=1 Tax=Isoptericola jiangsuensis TaxID=548579 RepID=A0A2A9ESD3_9MICO|nr:tetratricopeptide repeat protein [Isoptericola jiangsuensis]PFG41914.1 tetratricopeptide repeat protein [Isoptericola jiangsuensis]
MTEDADALADLRDALRDLPGDVADVLFDVANDLRALAVRADVVEAFYRAAIHHGDTDSYLNLANVLADAGDDARALDMYRDAWRHGDVRGAFMAAQALEDAGAYEEARDGYAFAAEELPEASYRLSRVLTATGEHHRAEAVLRGSAETSWESAVDLALSGTLPADDATALLRRHHDAGDTEVAVTLGVVLERAGHDAEARDVWRRAADGGDARAATNLALALDDLGDHAEARTWWRRAADGGDEKARLLLAEDDAAAPEEAAPGT